MEITQINIPHIPDLKTLLGDTVQVPNVEMGGIIEFVKENWLGLLLAAAFIGFVLYKAFSPKKVENDKPNGVSQATPFNQPITYIQRPNGNVGQ